jgi:hypothetical protein
MSFSTPESHARVHPGTSPVPALVVSHDPTGVMGPAKFRFRGEKLVGEKNFMLWRKQMQLFIRRHSLGGYVEPAATGGAVLDQMSLEAIGLFDEMLASIAGDLAPAFLGADTVVDLWTSVNRRFCSRSATKINIIRSQLEDLKLQEKGDLNSFLDKFKLLVLQLKSIDPHVSEDQMALLLLRNIKSKEYQAELAVLLDKPPEEMSVESFADRLTLFSQNVGLQPATAGANRKGGVKAEEQLLFVGDKENSDSKKKRKFNGFCFN